MSAKRYILFFPLIFGLLSCGGKEIPVSEGSTKQHVERVKVDREARDRELVSSTSVNQVDLSKIKKVEARHRVSRSKLIKQGKWKGAKNTKNRTNWETGRDAELAKLLGDKKFSEYRDFMDRARKN